MNRQVLAAVALFCLSSAVYAVGHGNGHVHVRGSIVDTACAIATDDIDQSIDMGTLPISVLKDDGHGPEVPFDVHLVNCTLDDSDTRAVHHWKDVHITFDGVPDGRTLFAVQGAASGEGVAILDVTGTPAEPGKPVSAIPLIPGSMTLHYRMQIREDSRSLRPGNLTTALRYFMDYE